MNLQNHTASLKLLCGSIFLATILLLAFTVVMSGYSFEFDIDELYHVNTAYLIAHGYSPFKDFFLPYSPLFHLILVPLYNTFGFNLETIQWTRIIMIVLFAIRVIGITLMARMIFGSLTALLFVPLFLIDPLTEYASMQIRPDNFMLTIYITGLVLFIRGVMHTKKFHLFLSGIFFGLSLLISIKILPSIAPIFFIALFLRMRQKFDGINGLMLGFGLPLMLFCLYYLLNGSFVPMITNVIFDSRTINETLKYPVPFGNFYWPSNSTLYGLSFKPILFQYLWSLPFLAFAGAYTTFVEFDISSSKFLKKNALRVMLASTLVLQWLSLFFIRSVFIQYYMPITWLFGIFAAVALAKIIHKVEVNKLLYGSSILFLGIIYIYYLIPSLNANLERAKIIGTEQKAAITAIWNHIPKSSAVYPGVLFRPLAYPIPYGFTFYDLPQNIFNRYEPIQNYLEKNDVSYLNIDGKPWALPDETVKQYVSANYVQDKEYSLFWKRK